MPPRHSFLIKSSGRCSGMRTKPLWSCRISVALFKPRRADITKRNPRSKPHLKRWIVGFLLVRSRELESLALWLKEPTGQNTLILEVSSFRCFCAKHRDFQPGNFCTLCRILQVRVPIASLETVQKQCRNRALTLGQMKNNDFWSMTWWRFEWPQR